MYMHMHMHMYTPRSQRSGGAFNRLPAAAEVLLSLFYLWSVPKSSHNLVAEPGFEVIDIVPPNSGFFTLCWQQRTGCMPFNTSQEAHVPALHW